MNDELMFGLAVRLVAAKIEAHFITPATTGYDAWEEEQVMEEWDRLRRLWRRGHREGNVRPLGD